jgi:hypothetical protein
MTSGDYPKALGKLVNTQQTAKGKGQEAQGGANARTDDSMRLDYNGLL